MKDILNYLFAYRTLSKNQAYEVLVNISQGRYNDSEMAAFMTVYLMRSITVQELEGFREAMLQLCLPLEFEEKGTLDIVGTGGDGKNTFNISTTACFIAAGAGAKITKHGNNAVSSISGSSNVLHALGYEFKNNQTKLQKELTEAGICFIHAPLFHPAMKTVASIRKNLSVRTFFNIMGPLINPCQPKSQVLGVYDLEVARNYHYLFQNTDLNFSIVYSHDGYDEISLTGDTRIIDASGERDYTPENLGLSKVSPEDIYGGKTVLEAKNILLNILKGEAPEAATNVALANAAIGIKCAGLYDTYEDSLAAARESIASGKAYQTLKNLIDLQ